jgi:hypothetical protein
MTLQRRGSELRPEVQREVLARYTMRDTPPNRPNWTLNGPDGKPYPLQFASDSDWLANTFFYVKQDGTLDERFARCESRPTWPNNPELRK